MISGISLFDILQLLSMSGSSKVIEVNYSGGQGIIYIEGGSIVHAEANGKTGEEAVYDCLSEDDATFRELPPDTVRERTVHRTTAFLMLEAARVKDEKGKSRDAIGNENRPDMGQRKAPVRKEELLISDIGKIKSVIGAVLVRRNGEVMAETGDNINSTRTLSSLVVGIGEQLKDLLRRSRLEMVVVNMADDKKILIMDLKSAFLCVLIHEEGVVDLVKTNIISMLKGIS